MEINPEEALDEKTQFLANTIYDLRQDLDLHRVIALNHTSMKEMNFSGAFFGRVQQLALFSIAINFPKLFEIERGFELCSIPAILSKLPDSQIGDEQVQYFKEFEEKTGFDLIHKHGKIGVQSALEQFKSKNDVSLIQLKTYRDKAGAHLEYPAPSGKIPSHQKLEEMWTFANCFYQLVHKVYNNVNPALMGAQTSIGLKKTLERLGLKDVELFF